MRVDREAFAPPGGPQTSQRRALDVSGARPYQSKSGSIDFVEDYSDATASCVASSVLAA
jgi:hypothetical protein